jgi:hypothetical protein
MVGGRSTWIKRNDQVTNVNGPLIKTKGPLRQSRKTKQAVQKGQPRENDKVINLEIVNI